MLSAPTARHHTSLGQRPRNWSPKENGCIGFRVNPQSPIPDPQSGFGRVRVGPCLSVFVRVSVCILRRRITQSHSHAFLAAGAWRRMVAGFS